ncbi:hypothetical protein PMAYCL1PPCAC_08396, partial [Pristionchus mayeri]
RIQMTPQCILCKMYPKTPRGYTEHLERHHKTTLLESGIYLACSCGVKYMSESHTKRHYKKCYGHEFTLHKLDEDDMD